MLVYLCFLFYIFDLNELKHLVTYTHAAYTFFIHLPSASVCEVNPFNIDIRFVQLYSMLFVSNIVDSLRHVESSCLLCKGYLGYITAVIMWSLNFQAQNRLQIFSFWRLFIDPQLCWMRLIPFEFPNFIKMLFSQIF